MWFAQWLETIPRFRKNSKKEEKSNGTKKNVPQRVSQGAKRHKKPNQLNGAGRTDQLKLQRDRRRRNNRSLNKGKLRVEVDLNLRIYR